MPKFLLGSLFFTLSLSVQAVTPNFSPLSKSEEATECTYNTGECPGPGWFCLNGRCVQENTGERCYLNTECPIGSACINGVCK